MSDKGVAILGEMKKSGKLWIILLMLAAGVILLFVGNSDVFAAAKESDADCIHEEKLDIADYERALEDDIRELCLSLGASGEIAVSVRLAGSSESIYAKNSQNGSAADRDEYVIIGSGSNAHPLYLGERAPEILGIGVIISGDGCVVSKNQVEELLSAAYGVPLSRIYVKIISSG